MVAITSILCPVDFSDFSQHALAQAAGIANEHGASILALHVVPIQPPIFTSHLEAVEPIPLGLTDADRERLLGQLSAFTADAGFAGMPIDVDVVDAPTVHGEILAQAGRLRVDLIVMGTHGRTGFQRLLLGSVTEKVLRTACQPVLTVGSPAGTAPAGRGSFTKILCAVDFSECSTAALEYAVSLAEGSDAELTAIHVIEWTPFGYDPLIGPPIDLAGYRVATERMGRERLHKILLESAGSRHVDEIVASGKPHHEILAAASERGSDLIVLGIHGRNPVDRLLFGSTAEPVVRRATCPVLTVRG
jgi:nucleotide-binding universal stress UspA family protein